MLLTKVSVVSHLTVCVYVCSVLLADCFFDKRFNRLHFFRISFSEITSPDASQTHVGPPPFSASRFSGTRDFQGFGQLAFLLARLPSLAVQVVRT